MDSWAAEGVKKPNATNVCDYQGTDIHPSILELVFKLQAHELEHSNQVCIATLLALKEFLNDYRDSDTLAALAA